MSERPLTNPPTCTCQYLTVGNRLTTHNAVDSSRCEVHGPLSALRPPTPSGKPPLGPLDLARAHINGALEHIDDLTSPAIADLHCAIDYLDAHAEQPTEHEKTSAEAAGQSAPGIASDPLRRVGEEEPKPAASPEACTSDGTLTHFADGACRVHLCVHCGGRVPDPRTANPSPRVSVDAKIWAALVDSIDDVLSTSTTADYDEAATEMERVAGAAKSDASSEQCMADVSPAPLEHVAWRDVATLFARGLGSSDLEEHAQLAFNRAVDKFGHPEYIRRTPHPKTKEDSNG